jgi:hypothetical protein
MSEGMRRPPRIWEQKLEAMIKNTRTGFGAASTSPVVTNPAPGPGGPGEEPVEPPVLDPPEGDAPRKPANASVFAAIGGLSILWTGLDSNGVPVPTRSRVQVHVSTTTGFTPSEGTQRGLLAPGERLVLTDLTSGTTYFVRFVLVAPDGTVGEASDQVSAVAGFILSTNIGTGVISADMVSFDATAIGGIQQFVGTTAPAITGSGASQQPKDGSTWINTTNLSYYTLTNGAWVQRQWGQSAISAGAISTGQLAAGAITADSAIIANGAIGNAQIVDGAITNAKIQNATIEAAKIASLNADVITAGTITGRQFRTAASGERIKMADTTAEYGIHSMEFYNNAGTRVSALFALASSFGNIFGIAGNTVNFGSFNAQGGVTTPGNVAADGQVSSSTLNVSGAGVDMLGVYNNNTTGLDSVGITTAGRLRRLSSTQDIKYDMAALSGELSESVDPERQLGTATVTPTDVLDLAVTEFSVIDREFPEPVEGEEPLPPELVATERRVLGFIADDVADKFPIAATTDEDGNPAGVLDTAIVAALLAVVKDQQATITDLVTRIEALEA